ncbi:hypothetical protein GJ496_005874 [Pomphorhynchus laevis]|nr:hypothetical protein GJ496_005874 [Pomphorhynchus laevis]
MSSKGSDEEIFYDTVEDHSSASYIPLSQRLNRLNIKQTDSEEMNAIDKEESINEDIELNQEQLKERELVVIQLKEKGNDLFRQGHFDQADIVYNEAIEQCPKSLKEHMSILHSNCAACCERLLDFEKTIDHCSKAIAFDSKFVKPLLRRAMVYEKTDKLQEALDDFKEVLAINPTCESARKACTELPKLIDRRNEEMKEEMISKLKDIGNMILKPFGLSTDNFKMKQDPNSGSYSISMEK